MLTRPDKDALRALLESQVQQKLRDDSEAVTTYAAQRDPERKPYASKRSVQDKAFDKELDQMRADAEAGVKLNEQLVLQPHRASATLQTRFTHVDCSADETILTRYQSN